MAEKEQVVERGRAPALVWWCMLAGPLAWAGDLSFSYVLAQHACSTGHHYVLHVITIVCFLTALTGLVAGFSVHSKVPKEAIDKGPRPMDRTHFQVLFGLVFSAAFAIVIIAGAVPRWILSACD